MKENDHVLSTTDNNSPDRAYDKALESTVNKENIDYGQLDLHIGTTFQDLHTGQRGSFEHVPFQGSTFKFDEKYNIQGRFAFDVDELPIHTKRGDLPSYSENRFSKFSAYPEKSPMEESMDIGQFLHTNLRG